MNGIMCNEELTPQTLRHDNLCQQVAETISPKSVDN